MSWSRPAGLRRPLALLAAGLALWGLGLLLGTDDGTLPILIGSLGLVVVAVGAIDLAVHRAKTQAGSTEGLDWLMVLLFVMAVGASLTLAGLAIGHSDFASGTRLGLAAAAILLGAALAPLALDHVVRSAPQAPSSTGVEGVNARRGRQGPSPGGAGRVGAGRGAARSPPRRWRGSP